MLSLCFGRPRGIFSGVFLMALQNCQFITIEKRIIDYEWQPYKMPICWPIQKITWTTVGAGWLGGRKKKKGARQERRRGRKGRKEKRGGRSGRGREGRKGVGEWRKKLFSANLTRTKTMTCPPTQTLHTKSPLPYIKIKYRFKKILTYFESEIRTLHLQEDLLTETQTKYLP